MTENMEVESAENEEVRLERFAAFVRATRPRVEV
ncbi:hypothetical protein BH20ACT10_BH20ACT10_18100 [soil metagenome]|jgi:hypothetical protein